MKSGAREKVPAAVLCVGNLTVGGEGKTPVAIALAKEAKRRKIAVGFLTRGYGGSLAKPHMVDAEKDSATLVGDEPLLLARHAPTVIASDRVAGARRLIDAGVGLIIMDDGFQSARIHMDYALIVIDAGRGLGNGRVIPGGPLRAPLTEQMRHANAVVTMGEGSAADAVIRAASRAGRAVFSARVKPLRARGFKGVRVLAFAGIGNPQKFFDTLSRIGAEVVRSRSFPDHHPFTKEEIAELVSEAAAEGLLLVTTEKDLVRLRNGPPELRDRAASIEALPIEAVFDTAHAPEAILRDTINAWRTRALKS